MRKKKIQEGRVLNVDDLLSVPLLFSGDIEDMEKYGNVQFGNLISYLKLQPFGSHVKNVHYAGLLHGAMTAIWKSNGNYDKLIKNGPVVSDVLRPSINRYEVFSNGVSTASGMKNYLEDINEVSKDKDYDILIAILSEGKNGKGEWWSPDGINDVKQIDYMVLQCTKTFRLHCFDISESSIDPVGCNLLANLCYRSYCGYTDLMIALGLRPDIIPSMQNIDWEDLFKQFRGSLSLWWIVCLGKLYKAVTKGNTHWFAVQVDAESIDPVIWANYKQSNRFSTLCKPRVNIESIHLITKVIYVKSAPQTQVALGCFRACRTNQGVESICSNEEAVRHKYYCEGSWISMQTAKLINKGNQQSHQQMNQPNVNSNNDNMGLVNNASQSDKKRSRKENNKGKDRKKGDNSKRDKHEIDSDGDIDSNEEDRSSDGSGRVSKRSGDSNNRSISNIDSRIDQTRRKTRRQIKYLDSEDLALLQPPLNDTMDNRNEKMNMDRNDGNQIRYKIMEIAPVSVNYVLEDNIDGLLFTGNDSDKIEMTTVVTNIHQQQDEMDTIVSDDDISEIFGMKGDRDRRPVTWNTETTTVYNNIDKDILYNNKDTYHMNKELLLLSIHGIPFVAIPSCTGYLISPQSHLHLLQLNWKQIAVYHGYLCYDSFINYEENSPFVTARNTLSMSYYKDLVPSCTLSKNTNKHHRAEPNLIQTEVVSAVGDGKDGTDTDNIDQDERAISRIVGKGQIKDNIDNGNQEVNAQVGNLEDNNKDIEMIIKEQKVEMDNTGEVMKSREVIGEDNIDNTGIRSPAAVDQEVQINETQLRSVVEVQRMEQDNIGGSDQGDQVIIDKTRLITSNISSISSIENNNQNTTSKNNINNNLNLLPTTVMKSNDSDRILDLTNIANTRSKSQSIIPTSHTQHSNSLDPIATLPSIQLQRERTGKIQTELIDDNQSTFTEITENSTTSDSMDNGQSSISQVNTSNEQQSSISFKRRISSNTGTPRRSLKRQLSELTNITDPPQAKTAKLDVNGFVESLYTRTSQDNRGSTRHSHIIPASISNSNSNNSGEILPTKSVNFGIHKSESFLKSLQTIDEISHVTPDTDNPESNMSSQTNKPLRRPTKSSKNRRSSCLSNDDIAMAPLSSQSSGHEDTTFMNTNMSNLDNNALLTNRSGSTPVGTTAQEKDIINEVDDNESTNINGNVTNSMINKDNKTPEYGRNEQESKENMKQAEDLMSLDDAVNAMYPIVLDVFVESDEKVEIDYRSIVVNMVSRSRDLISILEEFSSCDSAKVMDKCLSRYLSERNGDEIYARRLDKHGRIEE